jgi:hypothetical protein
MPAHTPLHLNADNLVSKFIDLSFKKGGYLYVENFLKSLSYNVKDIMPYIKRNKSINYHDNQLKRDMNIDKSEIHNDDVFGKKSNESVKMKYRVNKEGVHLIIMQHGLQGCSYDFSHWNHLISAEFPHALILCAESNNSHNEESITNMAERLVVEIVLFCKVSLLANLRYSSLECLKSFFSCCISTQISHKFQFRLIKIHSFY